VDGVIQRPAFFQMKVGPFSSGNGLFSSSVGKALQGSFFLQQMKELLVFSSLNMKFGFSFLKLAAVPFPIPVSPSPFFLL